MATYNIWNDAPTSDTVKYNITALWVVVVLLVLWAAAAAGYFVVSSRGVSFGKKEAMSNPLIGLLPNTASLIEGTTSDQMYFQDRKSGFTGGYNSNAPAYYDSQALNDNTYEDGLNAGSNLRFFGADPAWSEFENKILPTISSVQVRTRYNNTTTGEKIAILVAQAARLQVPVPTATPPTEVSGMMDLSRNRSAFSDADLFNKALGH